MKVITRCICAVWSLEQFLLCTVFAYLTYRIWKSVLHEQCRGFHQLSNNMNCFFIGLEDLDLWRIDCTAIFLLTKNFRLLVLTHAHESLWDDSWTWWWLTHSEEDANYPLVSPNTSFLKGGSHVKEVARWRLHTFWCFTWKYQSHT